MAYDTPFGTFNDNDSVAVVLKRTGFPKEIFKDATVIGFHNMRGTDYLTVEKNSEKIDLPMRGGYVERVIPNANATALTENYDPSKRKLNFKTTGRIDIKPVIFREAVGEPAITHHEPVSYDEDMINNKYSRVR
ncbi:MAG: hypothetical protein HUJ68_00335 [Clostridia bacterium]|nr:hypothetical protein [Clostridia bacterium]